MKNIYALVIMMCCIAFTTFGQVGINTEATLFDTTTLIRAIKITTDQHGPSIALTPTNKANPLLPIHVAATSGATSGDYITLKDAFDSINSGRHQGAITIAINSSVSETASAMLNASTTPSDYSSVIIFPTATGISITGSLAAPLIDLNGADNVTIDGRVNASGSSKSLTITNTNTGTSASTIRFINDATNNVVKHCKIKGATTDPEGGVVFFSTATVANGNEKNVVAFNDISGLNSARPVNAVYSKGDVDNWNSNDTIRDNNIFNFLNPDLASCGVWVDFYNTNWAISGNSFYETDTVVPTANVAYTAIKASNDGTGYMLSGNYIGGSAAFCANTLVKVESADNPFFGIDLAVQSGTVRKNRIKNIHWSNSSIGNWTGIQLSNGELTVGGSMPSDGNIIGDSIGTGSIIFTGNYTDNLVPVFYGINRFYNFEAFSNVTIRSNVIGSIQTANHNNQRPTSFIGIYNFTMLMLTDTISNNLIGSRQTENSIFSSSPNSDTNLVLQVLYGIFNRGFGTTEISENYISNLNKSPLRKVGIKNQNLAKAQYISNLNCHDLKVVAIDNQIVTGL